MGGLSMSKKTRFMAVNGNFDTSELDIRDIDWLLVDMVHTRPGYLDRPGTR